MTRTLLTTLLVVILLSACSTGDNEQSHAEYTRKLEAVRSKHNCGHFEKFYSGPDEYELVAVSCDLDAYIDLAKIPLPNDCTPCKDYHNILKFVVNAGDPDAFTTCMSVQISN